MTDYVETKKKIDAVRAEYGCKGDIIFRTAIQIVVEAGQCTILDPAWYDLEMENIDAKHNDAEKNNKTLFITRDFEKAILECARELAEIPSYDLLVYIQKEIWLSSDGIDYQRAIELAKGSIAWVLSDTYETDYALQEIREIGFNDDEIEELGFGWMLNVEEEDK